MAFVKINQTIYLIFIKRKIIKEVLVQIAKYKGQGNRMETTNLGCSHWLSQGGGYKCYKRKVRNKSSSTGHSHIYLLPFSFPFWRKKGGR
jgi:hypothetical protein